MSAVVFIYDLLDSGRVRVELWGTVPDDMAAAVRYLDEAARLELPGRTPELRLAAATWALSLVYRAAQALIYREVDEQAVREALSMPCPSLPEADVCYSVDLAFRTLPDLISLARGLADDDPLVSELLALAKRWPLSSVGVKGLDAVDVRAFIGDRCLRRLYADRIIERCDAMRLDHPLVRQAVREALGAYPELAPNPIAAALQQESVA